MKEMGLEGKMQKKDKKRGFALFYAPHWRIINFEISLFFCPIYAHIRTGEKRGGINETNRIQNPPINYNG